ncbi:hypothetical protein GCM10011348_16740 [Marinobacterium nitratireducens]|uniref:Uncharacterized protein n=1 Tax=Marinobacterium nitratireducens TaxID=518897 RepID=A0A917ZCI0_9GAMM|nr:hypothetical protein [Marinobacterium nitratireducens]GGO80333.1 hypothetical protein GCM10011348_16740 [Marinobacterium nitratireducens]
MTNTDLEAQIAKLQQLEANIEASKRERIEELAAERDRKSEEFVSDLREKARLKQEREQQRQEEINRIQEEQKAELARKREAKAAAKKARAEARKAEALARLAAKKPG